MQLRIAYLYPEIMNIYGDRGNIIALTARCHWRGIKTKVVPLSLNQSFNPSDFDLFFGGGGQDRQQLLVAQDLQKKKKAILEAVRLNKVFLLVCGTYQLFGHYFKTYQGIKIPGIGVLDIFTIASHQRKIGNTLIRLAPEIASRIFPQRSVLPPNLIGFENHSGNTFIKKFPAKEWSAPGNKTTPLGMVSKGFGNNGRDGTEGAVYKNVFGTYLHGSLLPKNPHFTDLLIRTALEVRYQKPVQLKIINDALEQATHQRVAHLIK